MSKLDPSFWNPITIQPIPQLAAFREVALQHSEVRMPKWKLRLTPNLMLKLQPKPGARLIFEGAALMSENLDNAGWRVFDLAKRDRKLMLSGHPQRLNFNILQGWIADPMCMDDSWLFEATHLWGGDTRLRDQVISALTNVTINPSSMFSPNCIICGKGLTDPASMANMIGPECRGSGSLDVPFIQRPTEATQNNLFATTHLVTT
jgi:hypothetical protein